MRFSLKWALAVTAYVALAATAFRLESEFFADMFLWAIAVLAFCFAVIVACVERGRPQAKAVGFAVAFAAFAICLRVAPSRVPSSHLLKLAGYEVTNNGVFRISLDSVRVSGAPIPTAVAVSSAIVQAARAVDAMAAGLIGSLLGLLAFNKSQKRPPESPNL